MPRAAGVRRRPVLASLAARSYVAGMVAVRNWLRIHLSGSNTLTAWSTRLVVLLLLTAAAAPWYFDLRLSPAASAAFVAGWLLALAVFLRRGWLRLVGPLVPYELVRSARSSRFVL